MRRKRRRTPLQQARVLSQLTQAEVGAELGITVATLCNAELGVRMVKREVARKLYFFYEGKVSLSQIYDPFFEEEEAEKLKQLQSEFAFASNLLHRK